MKSSRSRFERQKGIDLNIVPDSYSAGSLDLSEDRHSPRASENKSEAADSVISHETVVTQGSQSSSILGSQTKSIGRSVRTPKTATSPQRSGSVHHTSMDFSTLGPLSIATPADSLFELKINPEHHAPTQRAFPRPKMSPQIMEFEGVSSRKQSPLRGNKLAKFNLSSNELPPLTGPANISVASTLTMNFDDPNLRPQEILAESSVTSSIEGENGSISSAMPFQVHHRIMGWKITTATRRKHIISLLDAVNNADDVGRKTNDPAKSANLQRRQVDSWEKNVRRLLKSRMVNAREREELSQKYKIRDAVELGDPNSEEKELRKSKSQGLIFGDNECNPDVEFNLERLLGPLLASTSTSRPYSPDKASSAPPRHSTGRLLALNSRMDILDSANAIQKDKSHCHSMPALPRADIDSHMYGEAGNVAIVRAVSRSTQSKFRGLTPSKYKVSFLHPRKEGGEDAWDEFGGWPEQGGPHAEMLHVKNIAASMYAADDSSRAFGTVGSADSSLRSAGIQGVAGGGLGDNSFGSTGDAMGDCISIQDSLSLATRSVNENKGADEPYLRQLHHGQPAKFDSLIEAPRPSPLIPTAGEMNDDISLIGGS